MDFKILVKIGNGKFDSLKMTVDAIVDDAYLSYKDQLVSGLEKKFASFEKTYGVKPKVESTSNGAKITLSMTAKQAEYFYGQTSDKKITKKEVIDKLSLQGYTCE